MGKQHQFPHGGADMVQAVRKTFLNLAMLCDHFQKIIQILRGLLLPDAVDVHGSPAGGGFQPGQPFQGGIVEYGISRNSGFTGQLIPELLQFQKQIFVKLAQGGQIPRGPHPGLSRGSGSLFPAGKGPEHGRLPAPHHHFIPFRTQGNQGAVRLSAHSGQPRHLHGAEQLADIVLAPPGKDSIRT